MISRFVALDLETTGLDPANDRIIEVGAVRFSLDGALGETISTYVRPGMPIPLAVQRLTGISDGDVQDAPDMATLKAKLTSFLDGACIVGHNIGFDVAFLRRAGLDAPVQAVDTSELARILLPELTSHTLGSVALALDVPVSAAHRALADAETSALVLQALVRRASRLPAATRSAIAVLMGAEQPALAEILLGGLDAGAASPQVELGRKLKPESLPQLVPAEEPVPVTAAEVREAFALACGAEPGFERRDEQERMAVAIGRAFREDEHWLIEAGTGVGKSLAYLIPAALFAVRNGKRVIISTNTINLQEQLLGKDVPLVRRTLRALGEIDDDDDLRVAVLKGRGNYLCRQRFTETLGAAAFDQDMSRLASATILWLSRTETGDRSELNLPPFMVRAWQRVSAQETSCLARPNRYVADGSCFLLRARRRAESAHIVIVNHALLLADIASGGNAIPTYEHLVIDEAHHLEDEATRQFGITVTPALVDALLDLVDGGSDRAPTAILPRLAGLLPRETVPVAAELGETVGAARARATAFFDALRLLPVQGDDQRLPIDAATRKRGQWRPVEEAWEHLQRPLARIAELSLLVAEALDGDDEPRPRPEDGSPEADAETLMEELVTVAGRAAELRTQATRALEGTDEEQVAWVNVGDGNRLLLATAPLDVAPLLEDQLFARRRTVVATSATLAVGDSMAFSAERIGLPGARTFRLGSPFDFHNRVLLGTVRDVPPPQDAAFTEAAAEAIIDLVEASRGRALVLCTSHAMVRQLREHIAPVLEEQGILTLAQGIDGSPKHVIDWLRREPATVVIGTASLWEGVDVVGDALSLLVIPRLPFAVPSDPVHRARGARYENAFRDYALPGAILRFRQGFGRLIRDQGDHGAVVVLDRRVTAQSYGRDFLGALPGYTPVRGTVPQVAKEVGKWLARER